MGAPTTSMISSAIFVVGDLCVYSSHGRALHSSRKNRSSLKRARVDVQLADAGRW
jgi:hypothetical protein